MEITVQHRSEQSPVRAQATLSQNAVDQARFDRGGVVTVEPGRHVMTAQDGSMIDGVTLNAES